MLAKRFRVTGRVQGVFYRASTKEKADQLGVKGWAQNLQDGSVLIEAEASQKELDQFIEWCHEGPMLAKVELMEIESISVENYPEFSIRY